MISPIPAPAPLLFMYGTQKSGTTWLRNVVGEFVPIERNAEWYLPALAEGFERQLLRYSNHDPAAKPALLAAALKQGWRGLLRSSGDGTWADKSAYPCTPEAGQRDDLFPFAGAIKRFMAPDSRRIVIVRDPRDVLVSSRHFFQLGDGPFKPEYLARFFSGWARCNLHWLASHPTLVVRFEDLKSDFGRHMRRVLMAAGIEVDDARFADVVQRHASIDEMQKRDPHFYRKGVVGDWHDVLTPADLERIWSVGGEAMSVFGYRKNEIQPLPSTEFDRFAGSSELPLQRLTTQGWTDAAKPSPEPNVLTLHVQRGDLAVTLGQDCIPPVGVDQKLLVMIEVSWRPRRLDGDDRSYYERCLGCQRGPLFGVSIVLDGDPPTATPQQSSRVEPRSYLYEDRSLICLELGRGPSEHERVRVHLFNGPVVEPFIAVIHQWRYRVVSRASAFERQMGATVLSDPAAA